MLQELQNLKDRVSLLEIKDIKKIQAMTAENIDEDYKSKKRQINEYAL